MSNTNSKTKATYTTPEITLRGLLLMPGEDFTIINLPIDTTNINLDSQEILTEWIEKGRPSPPPHIHKQSVIKKYAKEYGLKVFVETGTYYGDMVEAVKNSFEIIYSIELSDELHQLAEMRFRGQNQINLIQGDSGKKLHDIMEQLKQPALFWLDGHYSAGITARGDRDTPILEELDCILSYPDIGHVLIIDDARCFDTDPAYPTIQALKSFIFNKRDSVEVFVEDDSIRIVPTKTYMRV